MNIIIKLFINKGYIYYAIFNTFFSIFLNRKFIRFIKKMLKVIRVWCFFLTCIAIYWPFPEKKKKMNSLTSRKIVAVGQGHVLSTNLSFLLKTLLFTRVSSVLIFHIQYSIPSTSKIIPRSRQLSLNSSLNLIFLSYSTIWQYYLHLDRISSSQRTLFVFREIQYE